MRRKENTSATRDIYLIYLLTLKLKYVYIISIIYLLNSYMNYHNEQAIEHTFHTTYKSLLWLSGEKESQPLQDLLDEIEQYHNTISKPREKSEFKGNILWILNDISRLYQSTIPKNGDEKDTWEIFMNHYSIRFNSLKGELEYKTTPLYNTIQWSVKNIFKTLFWKKTS